jgi:riboflavin kinase/FMN adenylyltransferase
MRPEGKDAVKVVHSLEEIVRDKNSVVTVGTFDGVHLAHQAIVRELLNRAKMREGRSLVLTFDPHPKEIVPSTRGGDVLLLTTVEERVAAFSALGLDEVFVIPFTSEFAQLSPHEFYRRYVVNGTGVSEVVVGYDHMFGRGRTAGIEELMRMGKEYDFSVFAVHPFTVDGEPVSSTKIRRALAVGDLEHARKLLGYRYGVSGKVVRGDRRGATLGFPTANISPHSLRKALPAHGVYVVAVGWKGATYFGMLNIGVRPTVNPGRAETMEVHLFDFSGDLYGETLRVVFLQRLRDERRFANLEELVAQLRRDRDASHEVLAHLGKVSVGQSMSLYDVS